MRAYLLVNGRRPSSAGGLGYRGVPSFGAASESRACLPLRAAPSPASGLSRSPGALQAGADAGRCSVLLGLILIKGGKGSECWLKLIIMHIVCHLCWCGWCFEVSLALVLCLRQNCLLLRCSCYFTCFYVHFYFVALLCQFGCGCVKLCSWFYLVTFSDRSHALPCRRTLVWHWTSQSGWAGCRCQANTFFLYIYVFCRCIFLYPVCLGTGKVLHSQ